MASHSISTADWIEVTAETLRFEKYLIVQRRGSLMTGKPQYECRPSVGIAGNHA